MSSRSRRHGKGTSQFEAPGVRLAAQLRSWLPFTAVFIIVVALGLWFGGLLPSGSGAEHAGMPAAASNATSTDLQQLPGFITGAAPRVQEAYAYAADHAHGDQLVYIPCYCGCGGHSGHRYVRDCFVKQWAASGITFEPHGSQCDVCVSIALDVKTKLGEGQTLASVRSFIDAKYSKIGPGTNTPLPPGMEE